MALYRRPVSPQEIIIMRGKKLLSNHDKVTAIMTALFWIRGLVSHCEEPPSKV